MNVLLTGANGFVGSHILDRLLLAGMTPRLLLRRTSDTSLIDHLLPQVEVHYGSLERPDSLRVPVRGADCIIHCAGKTKSTHTQELLRANQQGTMHLVEAGNEEAARLQHFIHISSLSVSGPGTVDQPVSEDSPPNPLSRYGKSKMLAESEVIKRCRTNWTILRPGPVYGPGDKDMYMTFKPLKRGFLPLLGGGRMRIALVYAPDVADAVMACLGRAEVFKKIYHVAAPEPVETGQLLRLAARLLEVQPREVKIPTAALYPVCLFLEAIARLTGRQLALNLDKLRELRAPGWVCATSKLARDIGFEADTPLERGLAETFEWYHRKEWL